MKILFNSLLLTFVFFCALAQSNELKVLEKALGIKVDSYQASEVKGFNKLITDNGIIYASLDNKYIFTGNLLLVDDVAVNLTQQHLKLMRKHELTKNVNTAILYKSRNERFTVDVFMDVDCYYCKKIHQDIDQYLRQGISLRYYARPSGDTNSASFKQLNSIWCSSNKRHKVNLAMANITPKYLDCDSAVQTHQKMAKKLGINATPVFILSDGSELVGYRSPNELLKRLH